MLVCIYIKDIFQSFSLSHLSVSGGEQVTQRVQTSVNVAEFLINVDLSGSIFYFFSELITQRVTLIVIRRSMAFLKICPKKCV